MRRVNVLLITPSFNQKGGVSEFNRLLVKYGKSNFRILQLRGLAKKTRFAKAWHLLIAITKLNFILLFRSVDIVHVNPSLGKNAVYRDGNFIRVVLLYRKKIFVHWHGWNPANVYLLTGKHKDFFKKTFFRATHIEVLSKEIERQFRENGFVGKISIGNTFVDDQLLPDETNVQEKDKSLKILFLSTVSKNKGIYVALEAIAYLQQRIPEVELVIAGTGEELEKVKELVSARKMKNVMFAGHVEDIKKRELFQESLIYVFPSQYEGMPTSVLEAMAMGLPIVCSSVGAIPDFFEQERMGYMLSSFDPKNYAGALLQLINNKTLIGEIQEYNKKYALEYFLASASVARIEKKYENLLNEKF